MENVSGQSRPYLKKLNKREQRWTPWDSEKAPRMSMVWHALFETAGSVEWFGIDDVLAIAGSHGMNRESSAAVIRHAWKLNLIQKHGSRRGTPVYRADPRRLTRLDWHIEPGVPSSTDLRRRA